MSRAVVRSCQASRPPMCGSFLVGSGFGGVAPEKFEQLGIAEVDKADEGCNGIVVGVAALFVDVGPWIAPASVR